MNILSATLASESGDAVLLETEEAGAVMLDYSTEKDHSGGWQEAYAAWKELGNVPAPYVAPTPDPIAAAEDWVNKFFSSVQLLKMAMWVQQKSATNSVGPKLGACAAWEAGVESLAAQGQMTFEPAPFTFSQVANEVLNPQ